VLAYPHIAARMVYYRVDAGQVLAGFDAQARLVDVAPRISYVCKDADDQKFIDLAAAHRAILLSKDKAVICMRKRLLTLDAHVATALVLEPAVEPTLADA
jgi:predicted nucleic acid-binding protein